MITCKTRIPRSCWGTVIEFEEYWNNPLRTWSNHNWDSSPLAILGVESEKQTTHNRSVVEKKETIECVLVDSNSLEQTRQLAEECASVDKQPNKCCTYIQSLLAVTWGAAFSLLVGALLWLLSSWEVVGCKSGLLRQTEVGRYATKKVVAEFLQFNWTSLDVHEDVVGRFSLWVRLQFSGWWVSDLLNLATCNKQPSQKTNHGTYVSCWHTTRGDAEVRLLDGNLGNAWSSAAKGRFILVESQYRFHKIYNWDVTVSFSFATTPFSRNIIP